MKYETLEFNRHSNYSFGQYFTLNEFNCKCSNDDCQVTKISEELIDLLQLLRARVGHPIHVLSGYRCSKHNTAIGSNESSQHRLGKAADIVAANMTPIELHKELESILQEKREMAGGLGLYKGFCHIDVRDNIARWNNS